MPLDAGQLDGDAREWFFDTKTPLFDEYKTKPQLIIGRRGSGKTAFIESAYFADTTDIVVSVDKAVALGQVVVSLQGIPEGGRYPEAVAQLWDGVLMTIVLQSATSLLSELKIGRDYLAKIGATEGGNCRECCVGIAELSEKQPERKKCRGNCRTNRSSS